MSRISGKPAPEWIEENKPESGLFRVYWKGVINFDEGGLTFDENEGEGTRWEWYYKDGGRADGESKGWFPSGQIKQLSTWKNGKLDGKWIQWEQDGTKLEEQMWKNGKRNGKRFRWHDKNVKIYEQNYKDDIPHGKWIYWESNGKKKYEETYKNGILWDVDLNKAYNGGWLGYTYKDGKRNGK